MTEFVIPILIWYLLVAAAGWLAFPLAYYFLRALPDRGYAFVRPLGMLLWGFVFWLLSSYGLLANDHAGLLVATALVAAASWWALRQLPPGELRAWLGQQRGMLIAMEAVFLLAFVFMALIRVARPEIYHTEQPMELAFINAILRSPGMPPHDPWLSGFSISYYYFGYLMIAMLAKLSGLIGSVAFNLGFITTFASAALGAFGLAYNLLVTYKPRARTSMLWLAGLAPLFILVMSNAEGLLELAHARHLFWQRDASGAASSGFWAWLDVDDLTNPPAGDPQWQPRSYGTGSWWWWRASRVINDKTLSGGDQELIDEFPAFSFTLGDLHPHVLSMPFVMLATALALNVYLGGAERKEPLRRVNLLLQPASLGLYAVVLGGLAFLNIWDFPIYVGLVAMAYALRMAAVNGWTWQRGEEFLRLSLLLGFAGIALYLPFYLAFTSQAGGILPNLINPSRGAHLWIMFAAFFLLFSIYLFQRWRAGEPKRLLTSILYGFAFVAGLWAFSLLLAWLYSTFLGDSLGRVLADLGAADLGQLLGVALQRRLTQSGGWITLAVLLGAAAGLLLQPARAEPRDEGKVRAQRFVTLLIVMGTLLVIAPEFVYLRDQFSTRMNTVFKFFFQAWQLWGVAGAVIVVILLDELRGLGRALFTVLVVSLLAVGLIYPTFSFSDVTRNPVGSLDGASHLPPEVVEGIEWLRLAPLGPLAEAVGGSYDSNYARYATHSGQPGLMGWPGHEGQWRGGNVDWARISDIEQLYSTTDWTVAQGILDKYDVRYVIVGDTERVSYAVEQSKFDEHLLVALQNPVVTIYQVP